MGLFNIPVNQAHQTTRGAAAGQPIDVQSICSSEKLLAVVKFKDGGRACVGLDPAQFSVGDHTIASDTLDTAGWMLDVVWATQPVADA
jgi:hypothetical protein